MPEQTDAYYINEVLQGNREAFAHLVNRYQDMVYSVAVKVARNREEAREIAQATFVKAYQALPGFKGKARFSSWLYRITYNTAISHTRSHANDAEPEENSMQETAPAAFQEAEQKEQVYYLREAIKMLKPQDAMLVTLFHLQEESIEEVSRQSGLSVSNVKVRLHRARKLIYTNLQKILQEEPQSML